MEVKEKAEIQRKLKKSLLIKWEYKEKGEIIICIKNMFSKKLLSGKVLVLVCQNEGVSCFSFLFSCLSRSWKDLRCYLLCHFYIAVLRTVCIEGEIQFLKFMHIKRTDDRSSEELLSFSDGAI